MAKILIGSKYFFSSYPTFVAKDTDTIEVIETDSFNHFRHIASDTECVFQLKKQKSYEDYINWDIAFNVPMAAGKYLVPEFCAEIGFPFEALIKIKPMIDKLDSRHEYEKIIFESYLKNGSFTLTDEQRALAYLLYRISRDETS